MIAKDKLEAIMVLVSAGCFTLIVLVWLGLSSLKSYWRHQETIRELQIECPVVLPPPADDAHRIVQETCIRCHIEEEIIK